MSDDPKDVALALLLGWRPPGPPPLRIWWNRDPTYEEIDNRPNQHGRVWVYPSYYAGRDIYRLNAMSANAAVEYDTK